MSDMAGNTTASTAARSSFSLIGLVRNFATGPSAGHAGDSTSCRPVKPKYLLRDCDSKFVQEFDAILASEGIAVTPIGVRAPNQNAVAERFVQSVRRECLVHFVVFGETHLRYIMSEYLLYDHRQRPHEGLGNQPLDGTELVAAEANRTVGEVVCEERRAVCCGTTGARHKAFRW